MDYQLLTPSISVKKDCTPIEWVFANRGIESSAINHYLHTTEEDILNPELMDNMEAGAKMLIKHLAAQSKIYIFVDPDVDGFTSSAFLLNYLNKIFPGTVQNNIKYHIPNDKFHGVILKEIPEDINLVIVPDAGSNQNEEYKILEQKGIDVLVLDHHHVEEEPYYACVINNQLCNYPNKTLSGVGVVYKFCQYLDKLLNSNYANDLLDLVALGLVSDMVDLRNYETRELITLGTTIINNPFIIAFSEAQNYSLKGELTPFGISFYIAPYINATIRMGDMKEKLLLFESMLEFRAYEKILSTKRGAKGQLETRVEQACRNCKNIKNRQQRAVDTSLEIIEAIIQENNLLEDPILIIQLDEPIEANLTGLIANQIMGKYMHPVLLLNHRFKIDETTGEIIKDYWAGSGRNATYSKLQDMRQFLEDSNLVEYASGHASAFGLAVTNDNLISLKQYIKEKLKDFDFSNFYRVDFIWNANQVNEFSKDIIALGNLEHIWGQEIPKPQVAIENIKIHGDNLILMSPDKKPTLKIILPGNLALIKFGSSQEEYNKLYSDTGCVTVNIIGTCNSNVWGGNISPQIIITDYEIVSKSAYYF